MKRPPCEISWFSALCDDDYEFLGVPDLKLQASWEHCRDIVLQAESGGFDNILLPSGYELGIDTVAFAAGIAPMLKRMRLLMAVRIGEMWPPQLARQIATIDRMLGGRLTVNIQCDGDLMFAPGILWTAAHHKIPVLHIMHNNRAYHQEVMQVQIMAERHSRGIANCGTGTTITGPDISYAKLAESMGMYGEGPISDPKDLGPAIKRAIEVVKRGEPALVDVVTQPR